MIDSLTPDERSLVLQALLQNHPELREEAATIAASMLATADIDQVAGCVEQSIRGLDLSEMNHRAGRGPDGYVEPVEAAWEILEEEIEPFTGDLRRRLDCSCHAAARSMAIGIVLGLYRCRRNDGTELLAWAEDFPAEAACDVLILLAQAGPQGGSYALPDRLIAEAPEWVEMLQRAVVRALSTERRKGRP